ncbi:DUF551 domain-containing protein [Klebsiella michiganensis]
MTSKLTRERIELIANFHRAMTLPPSHDEIEELARIALAAMDSELVAEITEDLGRLFVKIHYPTTLKAGDKLYRHMQAAQDGEQLAIENYRAALEGIGHIRRTLEETFGGLHGTHVEPDVLAECKAICDAIYAAYGHAQAAPVVPEEKPMSNPLSMYAVDAVAAIAEAKDWSACRAAMLAAAQHDTPALNSVQSVVTVPGKWIPVSERMPETDGNYWGWWSESKRQGPVWFIKSELQAQFQSHEITHWMPLPAAPQEVKGE